jgi:hypothetical protein
LWGTDEGFYFNLPVVQGADGAVREMINLGQFLGAGQNPGVLTFSTGTEIGGR